MTHESLIEHLANEAKRRMDKNMHQSWRHAIAYVCNYSPSLMKEVGRSLALRGVVKRMIEAVKRKEVIHAATAPKQLTLF